MEHHAQLILGSKTAGLAYIGTRTHVTSVDVVHHEYDCFTIHDARALIREAQLLPVEHAVRTFILIWNTITIEAQNALLKLFEEPDQRIRFYIITERIDTLLPTLRSRLSVEQAQREDNPPEALTVATHFFQLPVSERMALIAKKVKAKDTVWEDALLTGIEIHAHRQSNQALLQEIIYVRGYFSKKGAAKKMLLEHLALSITDPTPRTS